jgi:hypothetical protein
MLTAFSLTFHRDFQLRSSGIHYYPHHSLPGMLPSLSQRRSFQFKSEVLFTSATVPYGTCHKISVYLLNSLPFVYFKQTNTASTTSHRSTITNINQLNSIILLRHYLSLLSSNINCINCLSIFASCHRHTPHPIPSHRLNRGIIKMKVLLVPASALLACFSFSAVASPFIAARAGDSVAEVAANCVASDEVFTSLDYEFTMEATEKIWGEPKILDVSVPTLPGSSEHHFQLSSSGTASQVFKLSGGMLTSGDTFCSISWSDPSAHFDMFPHCEKERTSILHGQTWAAYETCLPGTDHAKPILVVTPVFGKNVNRQMSKFSNSILMLDAANHCHSIHLSSVSSTN